VAATFLRVLRDILGFSLAAESLSFSVINKNLQYPTPGIELVPEAVGTPAREVCEWEMAMRGPHLGKRLPQAWASNK